MNEGFKQSSRNIVKISFHLRTSVRQVGWKRSASVSRSDDVERSSTVYRLHLDRGQMQPLAFT